MNERRNLIPVNVITGFLGSGKTTLLRRLLKSPHLRDTAVLVNEVGEIGLDHHLLEQVAESALLLENGCVCCALRGDLKESLRDLFSKRERGEISRFQRVVLETSGLADPVPIAYTILADPVIQHHFRLGKVITVVDAVNGARQLQTFPESVKQAAAADWLVMTKNDICDASESAALADALRRLNPPAAVVRSAAGELDPVPLLVPDIDSRDGTPQDAGQWQHGSADQVPPLGPHDHGVTSFCLLFDEPLDWTAFGIWMTMLLNQHGERVLRIKGLLNVVDVADPVLINGVQHIVHPPAHLDGWPDADRRSRIVFIVKDLARARIEHSLAVFNALANPDAGERVSSGGVTAAAHS